MENAESYYDAGALVVWKMPRAPRGKPNGKAYRIYMHLPNLTTWGLLRTIFKEGLCSSLFYLMSALDRCVELGISGFGDRATGGSHARASAAWEMLCRFFLRSDPDQILDEILMCPIYLLNSLNAGFHPKL